MLSRPCDGGMPQVLCSAAWLPCRCPQRAETAAESTSKGGKRNRHSASDTKGGGGLKSIRVQRVGLVANDPIYNPVIHLAFTVALDQTRQRVTSLAGHGSGRADHLVTCGERYKGLATSKDPCKLCTKLWGFARASAVIAHWTVVLVEWKRET